MIVAIVRIKATFERLIERSDKTVGKRLKGAGLMMASAVGFMEGLMLFLGVDEDKHTPPKAESTPLPE
jgi:hypothetical protein